MHVHCQPDDSPVSGTSDGTYGELFVCGTCGMIKGPVPELPGSATQLCECVPVEVHRAQLKWDRYDFNCAFELCCCCGLTALQSGVPVECLVLRVVQSTSASTQPTGRALRDPYWASLPHERHLNPHRPWGRCFGRFFRSVADLLRSNN